MASPQTIPHGFRAMRVLRQPLNCALALLMTLLAAFPVMASAQPLADTEYHGALADGGAVSVTINAERTEARLSFSWRRPQIACPSRVTFEHVPLSNDAESFAKTGERSEVHLSASRTVSMTASVTGHWQTPNYWTAAGTLTVVPEVGSGCAPIEMTWFAGRQDGSLPRGVSSGVAIPRAIGNLAGTGQGTITVSTNEFASGIQTLEVRYTVQRCLYDRTLPRPIYFEYGPGFQYIDGSSWSIAAVEGVDGSLSGGLWIVGADGCPSLTLDFFAQPPLPASVAASVTQTGVPVPSVGRGILMADPTFDPVTYLATAVFTGGSADELEAMGLVHNVRRIIITDSESLPQTLEVGGRDDQRRQFKSHFPNGIAAMTLVTLSRQ